MPTEEEWVAIISLAVKAKNEYGKLYDTENQFNTVIKWSQRWIELRKKNAERAKKYNKEHAEWHREYNRAWSKKKKENKK